MNPVSIATYWTDLNLPHGIGEISSIATNVETIDGPIRVGLDSNRCRHLLVPCGDARIGVDRHSRGVLLVEQSLIAVQVETRFADLVCVDSALESVFSELADDVCRKISAAPDSAIAVLRQTLKEWRDLLRYSRTSVDRSAVIGLRGELEVLRALAERSPADAISAWRGPRGGTFDFQRGEALLEVKSSTAQDGHVIHVNGLQQLAPPPDCSLNLAFVRLRADDLGESVPSIIADLYTLGVNGEELDKCLELVGYRLEIAEDWAERFRSVAFRVWEIGPEFPGLRESRIQEIGLAGVADVTYALNLDAGGPPLDRASQVAFIDRLATSS